MSVKIPKHKERQNRQDWRAAPVAELPSCANSGHYVHFYEDESSFCSQLAEFIVEGLKRDETVLVIATSAHREALAELLTGESFQVPQLRQDGRYVDLDAADLLAKFLVDGQPDRELFTRVVGSILERALQNGPGIRAFGEMVSILCECGNSQGAVALEALWNELFASYSFQLFCAYPMSLFKTEAESGCFRDICDQHSRVLPAESYGRSDSSVDERLKEIAVLQQQAAALKAEVAIRTEAQKALARRERELRDFLETASEGIHQVSGDGIILWANRAELEMLGYTAEEYIGKPISSFYTDSTLVEEILCRLKRGEALREQEACLRHKDGSVRYVSINSTGHWEGDKFINTRCFTRDITERKRASEVLEKTVAERTAQLHEKMCELESFSYSVSHDMRSPLRAIHAYTTSLIGEHSSELHPDAIAYLERIKRAVARMDLLTRDVLAFSKVSKGRIEPKPVNLAQLVDDVLQDHLNEAVYSDVIQVQPLPFVLGHEAYLTQCFTNLIGNALKFVRPGVKPKVVIRAETSGDFVRVVVGDNGIGIAPEHRDRVFEIFGRIHSEKRYPGTGIGLAIVSKAVARMGGEVGFDSTPGAGSSFWLKLPRAAAS